MNDDDDDATDICNERTNMISAISFTRWYSGRNRKRPGFYFVGQATNKNNKQQQQQLRYSVLKKNNEKKNWYDTTNNNNTVRWTNEQMKEERAEKRR